MTRGVSFHPLAEQELNDAASYYNVASPGLGATFLDEVERALKLIRSGYWLLRTRNGVLFTGTGGGELFVSIA